MARLNTFVHVVEVDADGQQTGRAETFGPGVDLPQWAVNAISNDDVFEGAPPKRSAAPAAPSVADELAEAREELAAARARIADLEALAAEAGLDLDADSGGQVPGPYDDLTADQLREELGGRELPTSGAKASLRERLVADDAARQSAHENQ